MTKNSEKPSPGKDSNSASSDTPPYRGGDALIDALMANGATLGFGVPGESYLAALDAIYDRKGQFRFVTTRHEASAANMAEAAGKLTGAPGICFVTRGPGATHASIGLHTAYQDSTPLIMIIGQVATDQCDREAFQEINYTSFLSEVTKWTAQIRDPARISEYVGRAFRTATSGRPGPVALAIPEDILSGTAPRQKTHPYTAQISQPDPTLMRAFSRMVSQAKNPFFLIGGSGWDKPSVNMLDTFAKRLGIGIAVSFRCQDRMDNDLANYIGDMGIGANPALVKRMQDSDLIIAFGPRLGEMTTAGYTRLVPPVPQQTFIHIHQSGEELGRVYQPDLAIESAPGPFLKAALETDIKADPIWTVETRKARREYENWQKPVPNPGSLQITEIYSHINSTAPRDTILTNGAGNYAAWLHRFVRYRDFPSQLAPTSGAMGYGVPAAIAAKIMYPDRPVISFSGDGCFMMSVMELATAVKEKAGVIFLVFNNSLFGTIRMHQAKQYPGHVSGTELVNPDFKRLAESFGIDAYCAGDADTFKTAFDKALKASAKNIPTLIELIIDPDAISPTSTLSEIEN